MTVKETDLAGLKTMLDELTTRVKNATTNQAGTTAQDGNYNRALEKLNTLKAERDQLQQKLADEGSKDAIRPEGVMAELIDPAEVPREPFVPNTKVGLTTLAAGTFLLIVGFLLLLAVRKPPRPATQ